MAERVAPESYTVKWFQTESSKLMFWDTFDGLVKKAGFSLYSNNRIFTLRPRQGEEGEWVVSLRGEPGRPLKATDFPEGSFRKKLAAIISVRAVMPSPEILRESSAFSILNTDGKTIARALWMVIYPDGRKNPRTAMVLQPLRGYAGELQKYANRLPRAEAHATVEEMLKSLLPATEAVYQSRPRLSFEANAGMAPALRHILETQFHVMLQNEQGVLEDWDTEFLHDYRVAGRRMRSALSLIKPILHPGIKQELVLALKKLGRYTGPVRDLDVYLLARRDFEKMLPGEFAGRGFDLFFRRLALDRKKRFRELKAFMTSQEYARVKETWRDGLKSWQKHLINNPALEEMAAALLKKHFRKLIKAGGKLSRSSADERFHDLRIEAKKLRYLLEFFSSLYREDIIRDAIRRLKMFQDNLGAFNDYSVQIDMLEKFLGTAEKKKDQEQVKTLSALIAVCHREKEKLKKEYAGLYKAFADEKNQLLYHQLFGGNL